MKPIHEERRQHKRYKIENSVSISSEGFYQINDISKGGYSFRCHPYAPVPDFWETDILSSFEPLEGFPVKRAWFSLTENGDHEFSPMVVGVKFRKLTKKQDAHLSQLIQNISHSSELKQ
jgi:hypothetical protein